MLTAEERKRREVAFRHLIKDDKNPAPVEKLVREAVHVGVSGTPPSKPTYEEAVELLLAAKQAQASSKKAPFIGV